MKIAEANVLLCSQIGSRDPDRRSLHKCPARSSRLGLAYPVFSTPSRLARVCAFAMAFSVPVLSQQSETDRLIAAVRSALQPSAHIPWYADFEFWKLVSSFIGPLVTATIALWGARFLKELEARQATNQKLLEKQLEEKQFTNQKLMEKRIQVFDEAAPLLNNLYCFMRKVGVWKELVPPDMIKAKRKLDGLVYINEALFPDEFRRAYFAFIHTCFVTYVGPAQDARFRATLDERTLVKGWDPSWENAFINEEDDPQLLEQRYRALMSCFAVALGAK